MNTASLEGLDCKVDGLFLYQGLLRTLHPHSDVIVYYKHPVYVLKVNAG